MKRATDDFVDGCFVKSICSLLPVLQSTIMLKSYSYSFYLLSQQIFDSSPPAY